MSSTTTGANAGAPDLNVKGLVGADMSKAGQRRPLRVFLDQPGILIGAFVLILVVLLAVVGPMISGYDAYTIDPASRYQAPSAAHWFGTDSFGRDVFTRVALGGVNSLTIGALVTVISVLVGTVVGLYSPSNRVIDAIFMRVTDGLISFPAILLAMIITLALGQSTVNVAVALSFVFAPTVARVVRSRVLVERELSYVEVLRSQGAPTTRILWANILPNVLALLIVQGTYIFGEAVIIEAGLSFVGAGVPQPEPSWGSLVYDGRSVLQTAWWLTAAPGSILALTVLATALIGDGIRDAYDPSFLPAGVVLRFRRWAKKRAKGGNR